VVLIQIIDSDIEVDVVQRNSLLFRFVFLWSQYLCWLALQAADLWSVAPSRASELDISKAWQACSAQAFLHYQRTGSARLAW